MAKQMSPLQNLLKIYLHILAFQNIPSILICFPTKSYIFLVNEGSPPPYISAKSVSFFGRLPILLWKVEKLNILKVIINFVYSVYLSIHLIYIYLLVPVEKS